MGKPLQIEPRRLNRLICNPLPKPLHDLTAPSAEARSFDAWFFSQPKKAQEKMREAGVLPYREAVKPRHVFQVDPNSKSWSEDGEGAQLVSGFHRLRLERDSFISADHVRQTLRRFIDALALSDSFQVRRHVELCRWALNLPGRLPATDIARMYRITKQAVHKRASVLRDALAQKEPIPRRKKGRVRPSTPRPHPRKESILGGFPARGVDTPKVF